VELSSVKNTLILCLGNELLGDDGFGPEVARRLSSDGFLPDDIEVIFAPLAGFALLDLLAGRQRVLIVDTIHTGRAPVGTLHRFPAADLAASWHLTTSHQISLSSAIELGRRMELDFPNEIEVIAVEAEDLEQFGEVLSEPVQEAVEDTVRLVAKWIMQNLRGCA